MEPTTAGPEPCVACGTYRPEDAEVIHTRSLHMLVRMGRISTARGKEKNKDGFSVKRIMHGGVTEWDEIVQRH